MPDPAEDIHRETNLIQRVLRRHLIVVTARPLLTLAIALGLAVFSINYTIGNLGFLTSEKALISPDNRFLQLAEEADRFDDLDTFVVAIESRDKSRSLEFLHTLVSRLDEDHQNYINVFYRVDPDLVRPWALLYLDREDLLTLRDNIEEHGELIGNLAEAPGLTSFFAEINHEMASRMVGELFTGFLEEEADEPGEEPLDLDFLIRVLEEMLLRLDGKKDLASPWGAFFTKGSWDDQEEGYFWTDNDRYLLLFVTPRKMRDSFTNTQRALKALRKEIAVVQADFPGIQAGVTGQEALDEDEMELAFNDMKVATVISLLSLTTLLILFWRGVRRPLMEMTELLIALSWTFGLTTRFIGHLNLLSVTCAPLLLGLGIDYGIHWFARYQEEERLRGASTREGIQAAMVKLGPGIILAGVSASLSFFPLVLTGFRGLVELGIITSIGMIMTTVTTLSVLPALTLLFDKPSARAGKPDPSAGKKYFLKLSGKKAAAILVPALVATGLSLWGAAGVSFDLNMLRLQSPVAESVIWEKKLLEESDRSSIYGSVLARSLEEIREKTSLLEGLESVSEVQSVESLLPEEQEEKIEFLKGMQPLLEGVGSFEVRESSIDPQDLDRTLGRIRFKMLDSSASQWGAGKPLDFQMHRVRELIDQLRGRFTTMEPASLGTGLHSFEENLFEDLNDKMDILKANMSTRTMSYEDLPGSLLQRFAGDDLYLIRVFPEEDIWEPVHLGRFVEELQGVEPDVIGDPVTLHIFTQAFRNACVKAAFYAVIFIFSVLMITFRSPVYALLAMVPLATGTAWTLGLMSLFNIDFNLANTIFLPLIVGAGVEYGIILMQRWRQEELEGGVMVLPLSTAKGIILAGLTTTVGFGSLTISAHRGIHSLGLLAIIGSLSILAAAVLLLPSILHVMLQFPAGRRLHSRSRIAGKTVTPEKGNPGGQAELK